MKKLILTTVILISIIMMNTFSTNGQITTNDSLLNEYNKLNKKVNQIGLNINNFVKERGKARITIAVGFGISLIGSLILSKEIYTNTGRDIIFIGGIISTIGTIQFHLADRKLKIIFWNL